MSVYGYELSCKTALKYNCRYDCREGSDASYYGTQGDNLTANTSPAGAAADIMATPKTFKSL